MSADVDHNYDQIMQNGGRTFFGRTIFEKSAAAVQCKKGIVRHQKLISLTEEISKRITPHTPCKSGCHHCCHMAVSLSEFEAYEIERFSRVKINLKFKEIELAGDLDDALVQQDLQVKKWMGHTCPFLKDNLCSVYAVRPIACRTNFNLSSRPELCDLTKGLNDVPNLDLRVVSAAQAAIYSKYRFADIRDFFPPESFV